MNINLLLNWNYLTRDPGVSFKYQWFMLGFFGLCIIVSVALVIIRKVKRGKMAPIRVRLNKLIYNWLLYPSIVGLLLVFFRNQAISTLSWRLWLVALAIVWLSGIIYILYLVIFTYPKEIRQYQAHLTKQKYLS